MEFEPTQDERNALANASGELADAILDAYLSRKREHDREVLNGLKAGLMRSTEPTEPIPEAIAEELAEQPDDDEPYWPGQPIFGD